MGDKQQRVKLGNIQVKSETGRYMRSLRLGDIQLRIKLGDLQAKISTPITPVLHAHRIYVKL